MTSLQLTIECPVCLGLYTEPRILTNCGHSMCTPCIASTCTTHTTIKCPICSRVTTFNSITELPRNLAVIGIMQTILAHNVSMHRDMCKEVDLLELEAVFIAPPVNPIIETDEDETDEDETPVTEWWCCRCMKPKED